MNTPKPPTAAVGSTDLLGTDVIIERARSLHRVVRALHDGNCPSCGEVFPAEAAQREADRETCPYCGFHITHAEAMAAMEEFRPVMKRNLDVFEAWRAARVPNSVNNPLSATMTLGEDCEGV